MSILSLKPKSAVRELSKRELHRQQQAEINERRRQQLTRAGLTQRLRAVRDEILALDFVVKHPDDAQARENVAAMFARLIDLVQQVDATQATREVQGDIRNQTYEYFDHLLDNYIKPHVLTESFQEAVPSSLGRRMQDIYRLLSKAQSMQTLPVDADEMNTVSDEPTAPVMLPVVIHDDPAILTAARRLAETWQRATSRNLTVSDRFTVDAIATSYLPDSLRLLQNLSKYSAESKLESEKIFLEQLNLLQRQLDEIFKHEERNEISAMRAHTLFLESKLA